MNPELYFLFMRGFKLCFWSCPCPPLPAELGSGTTSARAEPRHHKIWILILGAGSGPALISPTACVRAQVLPKPSGERSSQLQPRRQRADGEQQCFGVGRPKLRDSHRSGVTSPVCLSPWTPPRRAARLGAQRAGGRWSWCSALRRLHGAAGRGRSREQPAPAFWQGLAIYLRQHGFRGSAGSSAAFQEA